MGNYAYGVIFRAPLEHGARFMNARSRRGAVDNQKEEKYSIDYISFVKIHKSAFTKLSNCVYGALECRRGGGEKVSVLWGCARALRVCIAVLST